MTSTVFVNQQTPIVAPWCNDVNTVVYGVLGNGTVAPSTNLIALQNLGIAVTGGSSLVNGGVQSVNSIAGLRGLLKTSPSGFAFVTGYYAAGDGGGGFYTYVSSDTTSADNGGTIIVATDGGRWYLSYTDRLSVRQFGAKGDGTTVDNTAFTNLISLYETNADFRGGTIHIPRGHYILTTTLSFTEYVSGLVHNMFVVGDGPDNTVLDWSSASGGIDGMSFSAGAHFGVEGLALVNAPGNNLSLNPTGLGGTTYCNYYHIRNVRFQGATLDNFVAYNSYMGEIANCWSFGAGQNGFHFGGFHTSTKVSRCEANENTACGWLLNGMIYSDFSCCGSDSNSQQGWNMTNMNAVTFNGCGAESNQKDAFLLSTSTASVTGIPSTAQDIHGVVFNGCFTTGNSMASAGTYASFITASTSNSRPIEFVINGGAAFPNGTSDIALILFGTSGAIMCSKDLFNDYNFTAADSLMGAAAVKNFSMTGRSTLVGLAAATESISNNSLTTVPITTASVNDLNCTITSNAIVIPRGVNKVRISCNVEFAANATGVRQVFIQKNGSNTIGLASCTAYAAPNGDHILTASSPVISTVAGDTYSFQVYQNSGGSLNLVQGTNMYICVEAVV